MGAYPISRAAEFAAMGALFLSPVGLRRRVAVVVVVFFLKLGLAFLFAFAIRFPFFPVSFGLSFGLGLDFLLFFEHFLVAHGDRRAVFLEMLQIRSRKRILGFYTRWEGLDRRAWKTTPGVGAL